MNNNVTILFGRNGCGKTRALRNVFNILSVNCKLAESISIFSGTPIMGNPKEHFEFLLKYCKAQALNIGLLEQFIDLNKTHYTLGELCLGIILMRILAADNNAYILIDDIEAFLDIETQQTLIETIFKIKPNCRLIVTTHSPSIFGKGWRDSVVTADKFDEFLNSLND